MSRYSEFFPRRMLDMQHLLAVFCALGQDSAQFVAIAAVRCASGQAVNRCLQADDSLSDIGQFAYPRVLCSRTVPRAFLATRIPAVTPNTDSHRIPSARQIARVLLALPQVLVLLATALPAAAALPIALSRVGCEESLADHAPRTMTLAAFVHRQPPVDGLTHSAGQHRSRRGRLDVIR
ncbi:hypothetical protein H8D79_01075 [PVC group bacterium]|nr:hypothetical protein [PVC group bacterium]